MPLKAFDEIYFSGLNFFLNPSLEIFYGTVQISIDKCAMNVVRFFLAHYLLALDRHMMCPVPMEEIGQKGAAKLCRVPTAGVIISRAVQNVPDYSHHCKVGLPQDVG